MGGMRSARFSQPPESSPPRPATASAARGEMAARQPSPNCVRHQQSHSAPAGASISRVLQTTGSAKLRGHPPARLLEQLFDNRGPSFLICATMSSKLTNEPGGRWPPGSFLLGSRNRAVPYFTVTPVVDDPAPKFGLPA